MDIETVEALNRINARIDAIDRLLTPVIEAMNALWQSDTALLGALKSLGKSDVALLEALKALAARVDPEAVAAIGRDGPRS